MGPSSTTLLLRQSLDARDPKLRLRQWSCSRLAPSDADAIGPLGDNSISLFVHFAQVARVQCEVDTLSFAGAERHPCEATQRANRRDWRLWKTHVQLHDFVTFALTHVPYIRVHAQGIACLQIRCRELQIAVLKFRVTKSIAERIKRLAFKIAVSPVLHRVVFKYGQLLDALVKRYRQPARWIIHARQRLGNGSSAFLA